MDTGIILDVWNLTEAAHARTSIFILPMRFSLPNNDLESAWRAKSGTATDRNGTFCRDSRTAEEVAESSAGRAGREPATLWLKGKFLALSSCVFSVSMSVEAQKFGSFGVIWVGEVERLFSAAATASGNVGRSVVGSRQAPANDGELG
jgi:hypothetical protein